MTSYDGEAITYDAIGNPTSYRGATLTWNGRQLASYTKGDLTITYKYDANGLRTQKTVNGVVYDYGYENGKLVYERKGDEYEVIYRYDADGNLFTVNRCILSSGYTSLLYAVNNTRGDVVALYKGGGGIYSTYTYDSWGKPIVEATEMSAENSIRYRGYVYDQETGLYYLQSRYYDPETGRFLNADFDTIFNVSILVPMLKGLILKTGYYVDLDIGSSSAFSMRNNSSINDEDLEKIVKSVLYLPIAFELYEELGIHIKYLSGDIIEIEEETFYQVPSSEDMVIKVTITAKSGKQYDDLTSGYHQTVYETVFYTGLWSAWSMYHSTSVMSREKNYSIFGKIIEIFGDLLSVVAILKPDSAFLSLIGALDTAVGVHSGIYDTLSWFEEANISRFDKYVYNLLENSYATSEITFLFSVIDCSIEYANQKRVIIYKAI